MNWRIVSALVAKDLSLFFKNRFFALVTVLALVGYTVIFFLVPAAIDETLEIGIFAPALPAAVLEPWEAEGLLLRAEESEEALKAGVLARDYPVGIVLPADLRALEGAGQKPQAHVYVASDLPAETRDAYRLLLQELIFMLTGQPLNVEATEEVLGPDMAGQQVPPRNRMLPLFAVFVLMLESMGLASLISAEIESGTLRALLVTPLRIEGLFVGKGLTGVALAFGQAALLMAFTGGLRQQPLLILVALFLGSLLVTGTAFMMASVAKDMMSVMAWGILAILLLALPSFNILLPGLASDWIQIIPSYYLVDTVHRVINFEASWADVGGSLLALLGFAVAFFGLGVVTLNRRFR